MLLRALQRPVEEQQIDFKVPPADLERKVTTDEAEIPAQLDQELFQLLHHRPLQVRLGVFGRKVKEFKEIGVFEDGSGFGVQFCQRC